MNREKLRAQLPPHPTARHTWAQLSLTDDLYFDNLPMRADSTLFEPTGTPRHSLYANPGCSCGEADAGAPGHDHDPWLSGSTADEARVMRQDDQSAELWHYGQWRGQIVRVRHINARTADITLRGGERWVANSAGVTNIYLGTPLPVFQ